MIQRGQGFNDWYLKSKGEELAKEIVSMGYPTVDYLLPDLFVWLQDMNWPGALTISDFLVTVGKPVIPYIKEVLISNDQYWKYNVISYVVKELSNNRIKEIEEELMSILRSDSSGSLGLDILDILTSKKIGHPNELMKYVLDNWIDYKGLFEQADRISRSEYLSPLKGIFDRYINSVNINDRMVAFHELIGFDGKQYQEDSFVMKNI